MTAASTAVGRYCTGSVRKSRITTIAPAAKKPAIWVRAPIASFTAVRAPLAPTENPASSRRPHSPRPSRAAPAWRARSLCACLQTHARSRISSAKETRKSPSAAGAGGGRRQAAASAASGAAARPGPGRRPRHRGLRDRTPTRRRSPPRRRQRSGNERQEAAQPEQRGERRDAHRERDPTHLAELADHLPEPASGSLASMSSPSSLPSWAITSVTATPCR